MENCTYEELEHTAEVGIRVRAATPAELFVCAARAMLAFIGTQAAEHTACRPVVIEALDSQTLLVDWLNELLYLFETSGETYDQIRIFDWQPTRLEAALAGGRPTGPPQHSIKAVTYHGLRLVEESDGWQADIYFDV